LSQQPVPGTRSLSRTWSEQLRSPLFGLAPDGVCLASLLALRAVVSYTTFSPLPESLRTPAVSSLWYFPSGRLTASPPACIPPTRNAKRGKRKFPPSPFRVPRWKVTRHRALRCSDFPPPACAGSDSPPFQNRPYHIRKFKRSNHGKFQIPSTKPQKTSSSKHHTGRLELETLNFFGAWCALLGT
jgi:hypothetical protein